MWPLLPTFPLRSNSMGLITLIYKFIEDPRRLRPAPMTRERRGQIADAIVKIIIWFGVACWAYNVLMTGDWSP